MCVCVSPQASNVFRYQVEVTTWRTQFQFQRPKWNSRPVCPVILTESFEPVVRVIYLHCVLRHKKRIRFESFSTFEWVQSGLQGISAAIRYFPTYNYARSATREGCGFVFEDILLLHLLIDNLSIQHIYHLKALTDKRNVKPPLSGLFFNDIATFFYNLM